MLTSFSASEFVSLMKRGELSALEVFEAHRARIEQVNSQINAMVVDRFDAARQEAIAADERRARGEPLGLLHGLPVSIKEMFDVARMPTTAGISKLRNRRVSRDAVLVRRWREAGAIVMGKTNVPQLGIMIESDNPVYGRTNNPWSLDRSPGGSSGGDAALIASGGSPLGLDSDGAGSIRQPAHFCGICGFKPTGGRLSIQGHWLSANWPADWAAPGPMARTVQDLMLGLSACQPREDERALPGELPVPWNSDGTEHAEVDGLRIGYYEQFDSLPAAPAVRRAVREAAAALESRGATLVPFTPDRFDTMWHLFMKIFYAEGLRYLKRQVKGSPVDDRIRQMFQLASVPARTRPLVAVILRAMGQPRMAESLGNLERRPFGVSRYCELLLEMHGWRAHFARQLSRERLDLILGPVSPMPAFPHHDFFANATMLYTGVYNLLAVPAGVVPVTTVRKDEESGYADDVVPRENVAATLWRANRHSVGLPIGVQLVGPWWKDGRVLHAMKSLEAELQARVPSADGTPPPWKRTDLG